MVNFGWSDLPQLMLAAWVVMAATGAVLGFSVALFVLVYRSFVGVGRDS